MSFSVVQAAPVRTQFADRGEKVRRIQRFFSKRAGGHSPASVFVRSQAAQDMRKRVSQSGESFHLVNVSARGQVTVVQSPVHQNTGLRAPKYVRKPPSEEPDSTIAGHTHPKRKLLWEPPSASDYRVAVPYMLTKPRRIVHAVYTEQYVYFLHMDDRDHAYHSRILEAYHGSRNTDSAMAKVMNSWDSPEFQRRVMDEFPAMAALERIKRERKPRFSYNGPAKRQYFGMMYENYGLRTRVFDWDGREVDPGNIVVT